MTVTPKKAAVLPNNLINDPSLGVYETCMTTGVAAPRVRLSNVKLEWSGSGRLLPLFMDITIDDPRLVSKYQNVVTPTSQYSTISQIFGVMTDYLMPGTYNTSVGSCFVDFGGLPEPSKKLVGSEILTVPVKINLQGVVVDSNDSETPFSKEIQTDIVYFSGSIN